MKHEHLTPGKRTLITRTARPWASAGLPAGAYETLTDGTEIPLVDGGAFDWMAKLTSNRRAVYIASGLGSQLVPLMFRQ
jgi:hypothetical protein